MQLHAKHHHSIINYSKIIDSCKQALIHQAKDSTLDQEFKTSANAIFQLFKEKDILGLKQYQTKLSPWPPIIVADTFQTTDEQIYGAWALLLEFHSACRAYLDYEALQEEPSWKQWAQDINPQDVHTLLHPGESISPGIYKIGSEAIHIITTQPLSLANNHELCDILRPYSQHLDIRLFTPSCVTSDMVMPKAFQQLLGNHSIRELNKLAFWSMVSTASDKDDLRLLLSLRPRYYGGPAGTPPWGLHEMTKGTSQSAAKARTAMMEWAILLIDSMHDHLVHDTKTFDWQPAHQLIIQTLCRSLSAVSYVGTSHKRTNHQVNELFQYTDSIERVLLRTKCPYVSDWRQLNARIKKMLGSEEQAPLMVI